MTLDIQKYLRGCGTFESLLANYSIKTKRHGEHQNLVLFKYDQIASPFAERIVQECRGIVLDEVNDWAVVSRAFDKFFNYGEGHAAPIDWATARVQEKVDGSLCVLYFYAGKWHVATTGTPDACGDVHMGGQRFSDLFWSIYGAPPDDECAGTAFYFELCSPFNRIVVVHRESSLTLLGARLVYGSELRPAVAHDMLGSPEHIRVVKEHPLGSFEEIAASFQHINPLKQEGYVVVDDDFNRVKVKHPGYVALHHAKDGMGPKAFVEIARSGETSEVETAFPEFKPFLADARSRVDAAVSEVEADYTRLKDIAEQKAFALEAQKTRCSAALFQIRAKKKRDARHFFAEMQIDSLMSLLGYKKEAA